MKVGWLFSCVYLLVSTWSEVTAQNYWQLPALSDYGNTLKRKYIITTPGNMGPNALPVPELRKGLVGDYFYFRAGGELHFGNGDFTRNLTTDFYYPVVPGKVAVELYAIPYEAYTVTDALKEKRRILDENNAGHAWGDYYISTIIQVAKDKVYLPDVTLAFTFKTASGNHLLNARFTDAPAYYFDLAFGKDIKFNQASWFQKLRIYGCGGLYIWQTNNEVHPQDDAILYGLGYDLQAKKWNLSQRFGGYYGYLNLRDRPQVLRNQLTWQQTRLYYFFEYEAGLHDFDFRSFKAGITVFPFRKKVETLPTLARR